MVDRMAGGLEHFEAVVPYLDLVAFMDHLHAVFVPIELAFAVQQAINIEGKLIVVREAFDAGHHHIIGGHGRLVVRNVADIDLARAFIQAVARIAVVVVVRMSDEQLCIVPVNTLLPKRFIQEFNTT